MTKKIVFLVFVFGSLANLSMAKADRGGAGSACANCNTSFASEGRTALSCRTEILDINGSRSQYYLSIAYASGTEAQVMNGSAHLSKFSENRYGSLQPAANSLEGAISVKGQISPNDLSLVLQDNFSQLTVAKTYGSKINLDFRSVGFELNNSVGVAEAVPASLQFTCE